MSRQAKAGADPRWAGLYRAGGAAAFLQLITVLTTVVVVMAIGPEPTSARETYDLLLENRLLALLRMDFASVITVALYLITSFAIYAAVKHHNDMVAALAVALMYAGVILSFADHTGFELVRLGDQYAAAETEAEQERLLLMGDTLVAANWWNSTAGFLAGVLMQGGMVLLSVVMLRSGGFSKATAYAGIAANGLDWLHVWLALAWPAPANLLLSVGGLVYLVWLPLLGWDLFRLARRAAGQRTGATRRARRQAQGS